MNVIFALVRLGRRHRIAARYFFAVRTDDGPKNRFVARFGEILRQQFAVELDDDCSVVFPVYAKVS